MGKGGFFLGLWGVGVDGILLLLAAGKGLCSDELGWFGWECVWS